MESLHPTTIYAAPLSHRRHRLLLRERKRRRDGETGRETELSVEINNAICKANTAAPRRSRGQVFPRNHLQSACPAHNCLFLNFNTA